MSAFVQRPAHQAPNGWWLLILLPAGPLAVGALRYLLPYSTGDDAPAMVGAIAAQPGRESAVLWLGLVAVLTLVPGVLAVSSLAGPTRLTKVALTMVVLGYLSLGGLLAPDLLVWSGVSAGVDQATLARILTAAHPTILISQIVFVVGHVIGTVLLGLALLRSGRIPSWAAWALTISQPLHFVAAVIVGSPELDLLAWSLTALGMGVAALELVRAATSEQGARPSEPAFA